VEGMSSDYAMTQALVMVVVMIFVSLISWWTSCMPGWILESDMLNLKLIIYPIS
jgi:hypothetical protein